MIYIKCGQGMRGATVFALDAAEAISATQTLQDSGVQIAAYANEEGDAVSIFALRLMAAGVPILVGTMTLLS